MDAVFRLADVDAVVWLILMVVLIIFEIATMGLYTIWFAGGSLIAFFVALMGFNGWVQWWTWIVVSLLLLFFTRPIAQKKLNKDRVKTNIDSLIGEKARVLEKIDNISGTGRAVVKGQEWMARSTDDMVTFEPDAIVVIEEIAGVKLIVKSESDNGNNIKKEEE